jgi:hypothetical protein
MTPAMAVGGPFSANCGRSPRGEAGKGAIEAFKLINTQQQQLAAEGSGASADDGSGSGEGSEEMSDLSAEGDDEQFCKMAKRNSHVVA